MMKRQIPMVAGAIFIISFLLNGCSAVPSQNSEFSSSPLMQTAALGSSLEALRRGETSDDSGPLKNIYFDFDRYDLRPDARELLKAHAAWLKANPGRVEIEGHCDERGTNEYNLALGAKRAQVTKDYLASLGIAADRLSTISYGEELPVCKDQTEQCWQRNRRARFAVATTGLSS